MAPASAISRVAKRSPANNPTSASTCARRAAANDTHVADFTHGNDKLELATSVFKSLDHVHYDAATGALLFEPGSVWSEPVQFATLAPHRHITAGDFVFV